MPPHRALAFLLLALGAAPLFAQLTLAIEPPDPTTATPIVLVVTEHDTCPPYPVVTRSGSTFTVQLGAGVCLSPPMPITYRLPIGTLEAGRYEVVAIDGEERATKAFDVLDATRVYVVQSVGPATGGTPVIVSASVEHCSGRPFTACPPPTITFGGVPATNVVATDNSTFRATTPPHAPGAVEVRVTSEGKFAAGYSFRYYDPAAPPLEELFDRILLPVLYDGPGQHGSVWATELTARNANSFPVESWRATQTLPPSAPVSLDFASAPGGMFLIVPREAEPQLHFNLLVRDLSRQASDFGTQIPVVREAEFKEEGVELLNVPLDPKFRLTLRVYGISSTVVGIGAYSMTDGRLIGNAALTLSGPCSSPNCASDQPAFASTGNLAGLFPALPATGRVGLRIQSAGQSPIWALLTVTNNETQHVTVISP